MKNILITGSTGNVGRSIIDSLSLGEFNFNLLVGVRNTNRTYKFDRQGETSLVHFDFDNFV